MRSGPIREKKERTQRNYDRVSTTTTIGCGIVSAIARLMILIIFTSLRSVPAGVYDNTNWTRFLPSFLQSCSLSVSSFHFPTFCFWPSGYCYECMRTHDVRLGNRDNGIATRLFVDSRGLMLCDGPGGAWEGSFGR